ncbi:hypothetical protein Q604_UNBc4C00183G0001, partial [human gut metagenome]
PVPAPHETNRNYRITRPENKFTVQEQIELIEKIIKEDLKNE